MAKTTKTKINITKQSRYDERMKALGFKKICVWAAERDHHKIKNTARLSRNRVLRELDE